MKSGFLVLLVLLCFSAKGQWLSLADVKILSRQNATAEVSVPVMSGQGCPDLVQVQQQIQNDTVFAQCFYNISGVWPAIGCSRTDTIIITGLHAQIHYVNISINLEEVDTTYRNLDDTTISLYPTGISETVKETVRIYPNPATDYVVLEGLAVGEWLQVFNAVGQPVLRMRATAAREVLSLASFRSGCYWVVIMDSKQQLRRSMFSKIE